MLLGLTETAGILQREGNLPRCSTPPMVHPTSPQLYLTPQTTPSRIVSITANTNFALIKLEQIMQH